MFKKTCYSIAFVAVALSAHLALAAEGANPISPNQGSDSCGLGWQVTQNKTIMGTSTRGTTNAYLSPTWSMTSGTSGCAKHEIAKKDEEAVRYVASNYYPLTAEMAEGKGEYVVALAKVMGCNDGAVQSFQKISKERFEQITQDADAFQTVQNLKNEIRNVPALSEGCPVIL